MALLEGSSVCDVLAWDHEHVRRHHRVDVAERVGQLIGCDLGAGQVAREDAAEQAVAHDAYFPTAVADHGHEDDLRALERWVADAVARESAEARARSRRLLDQASEDATFAGTLLDLAERGSVVLGTSAGTFTGVVAAVGRDFVAMATTAGRIAFVAMAGVETIRGGPGAPRSFAGDRRAPLDAGLAAALATIAADRPRVKVQTISGDAAQGDLLAVGDGVITIRLDDVDRSVAYVRVESIVALTVLETL